MNSPNDTLLVETVAASGAAIEENLEMIRDVALDYESAAIAVSEMEGLQTKDMDGSTLYSGFHPKHGNIHIIIPAAGSGWMLLPFVFRDF